jgi:hypothetical protein
MRLDVVGKAAHAGNNLADGISAIEELARKIVKLHALTDLPNGISCNVGTIAGGQRATHRSVCSSTMPPARARWARPSRAYSPAAVPTRALQRASAARPSAPSARSAAARTRRRNISR